MSMLIDAYRFGSSPPVSGPVTFVDCTGAEYIASGTTVSAALPSTILDDDGIYAVLFARSAITPPSGWTLVDSQANVGSVTQTLYVYRKDAVTSADSGVSVGWDQAASGRMGLIYLQVRSDSLSISEAETGGAETDGSGTYPHNVSVPTLTASQDGELFLIALTAELGTASLDIWSAPSGATFRSIELQANNRLILATQARDLGESNSSPATFEANGAGSGDNYYSALVVRLQG